MEIGFDAASPTILQKRANKGKGGAGDMEMGVELVQEGRMMNTIEGLMQIEKSHRKRPFPLLCLRAEKICCSRIMMLS